MNNDFNELINTVKNIENPHSEKTDYDQNKFKEIDGELYPIQNPVIIDGEPFKKRGYKFSSEPIEEKPTQTSNDKSQSNLLEVLRNAGDLNEVSEPQTTVADRINCILDESGEGLRSRTLELITRVMCYIMINKYTERASELVCNSGIKPIEITYMNISDTISSMEYCNTTELKEFMYENKPSDYYDNAQKYLNYDYNKMKSVLACNEKQIKAMLKKERIKSRFIYNTYGEVNTIKLSPIKPKKESSFMPELIVPIIGVTMMISTLIIGVISAIHK